MTLHGVDVFIWSDSVPKLPEKHGNMQLELISNRGTRIYPPPAPEISLSDWHQCRFLSSNEIKDNDVDNLLQKLSDSGLKWTKCQKLFKNNGENQFSEPY